MQVEITATSFFDVLNNAKKKGIPYSFEIQKSTGDTTRQLLNMKVVSSVWTSNYPSFTQLLTSNGQVQTQYYLHYEEDKPNVQD